MTEPLSKIEPLIEDIKALQIGDYLKSTEFKRYLVQENFDESWRNAYNQAKDERRYITSFLDHDYFDSISALVIILNFLFINNKQHFYHFVHDLLWGYIQWSKQDINIQIIVKDLELLKPPKEIIEKILLIDQYYSSSVPQTIVPFSILNAEKLDSLLKEMDSTIRNQQYNLTLTYAYSCLEGLFKTYVIEKIPTEVNVDQLNQLSHIVRDHIKKSFDDQNIKYPEPMLTLITTITFAISNARNSFSDAHFDANSEKWLAEFARDCVNTIGRLILKFI